jgi:hypothetical protein
MAEGLHNSMPTNNAVRFMGQYKAKRRREFFEKHPLCIYCGGETPATTCDHVPSRQVFHFKQWPEGYVFPSCYQCNQATKHAEQVMALLVHISLGQKTKEQEQEFRKIVRAIRNNYPDILNEMMSARPKQTAELHAKPWFPALVKAGIAAPMPLMLNGPLTKTAARMFARKLFTALYYKEYGIIIPAAGGIMLRWYSNVQRYDRKLPDKVIQMMPGRPIIQRARRNLGDQFYYVFGKAEDGDIAFFFVMFRDALAMLGFVDTDTSNFVSAVPDGDILRPLDPPVVTASSP